MISGFDLRVGIQGFWGFWSLVNYDLERVRFPLVKAELVVPSGAACIGRLAMVTPNWEHDNGPVSVNRPYDFLQSRDFPRGDALRQDVTAWLNTRNATVTGFQFMPGPGVGATCLSSIANLTLSVTALR